MFKSLSRVTAAVVAWTVLLASPAVPVSAGIISADEKVRLEDLAGDYEFEAQGQIVAFRFSVDQGKLFGAPLGETPEELKPVKDQPLSFDIVTADDGQYYLLKFEPNEKGIVDTCRMTVSGMEIVGKKIAK